MTSGLIIHIGLYSVPCFDDIKSLRRRKIQNGSEWYLKRLLADPNGYRPISGHKDTQLYHKNKYGLDYYKFKEQYTLENFDPNNICKLAKNAG